MRVTTAGRRALTHVLVVAVAGLGLLAGPPSAAAATGGIGAEVAQRRATWQEAHDAVEVATAHRADLVVALATAAEAEAAAAATVDAETALLAERDRDLRRADAALRVAEAELAAARAGLQHAVAAHERALAAALERRAELGMAATSAYTAGDPQVQALDGLGHAMDRSATVSEFLAATEQLAYVTLHARSRLDRADDAVAARGDEAVIAAGALEEGRSAAAAAQQARADAHDAAEAQRARRDDAVAAHAAAVEAFARTGAELARADTELAVAHERLAAALGALRSLGWRAGVPGARGLVWPVDGRPGSGFGPRKHPIHGDVRRHQGVDVTAPTGQPVVASAAGRVTQAGPRAGYGNTVVVDHGAGRSTLYAHLSRLAVRRGQWVEQADLVGRVGSTGQSTGPHLHFEVRERGTARNPLPYFR